MMTVSTHACIHKCICLVISCKCMGRTWHPYISLVLRENPPYPWKLEKSVKLFFFRRLEGTRNSLIADSTMRGSWSPSSGAIPWVHGKEMPLILLWPPRKGEAALSRDQLRNHCKLRRAPLPICEVFLQSLVDQWGTFAVLQRFLRQPLVEGTLSF